MDQEVTPPPGPGSTLGVGLAPISCFNLGPHLTLLRIQSRPVWDTLGCRGMRARRGVRKACLPCCAVAPAGTRFVRVSGYSSLCCPVLGTLLRSMWWHLGNVKPAAIWPLLPSWGRHCPGALWGPWDLISEETRPSCVSWPPHPASPAGRASLGVCPQKHLHPTLPALDTLTSSCGRNPAWLSVGDTPSGALPGTAGSYAVDIFDCDCTVRLQSPGGRLTLNCAPCAETPWRCSEAPCSASSSVPAVLGAQVSPHASPHWCEPWWGLRSTSMWRLGPQLVWKMLGW